MSELTKYLNSFETKERALLGVANEFGIKVKEYETGLYVFNYSQIDSPKTNEVVRDCRGAILAYDESYRWQYVCRPFRRFYNEGEAPDTLTDFDWGRAIAFEKADGSLIKVYMDLDDQWQIATRGTAYAESENYTGAIFRDMVLDAFGLTEEEFQEECAKYPYYSTHLFEFTSPENRIVTPYEKPEMVYLGSVSNVTGRVFSDESTIGWSRSARKYYLRTAEECKQAASDLNGLEEGFVCRDLVSGQMIKIKSPLYVAAHHLRGDLGLTPKKIVKLVVTNETEEYLKYFPEDSQKVEPVSKKWNSLQFDIDSSYKLFKDIKAQKEFAVSVKDLSYSSVLFNSRKTGLEPIKCLHGALEKYKTDLLTKYIEA